MDQKTQDGWDHKALQTVKISLPLSRLWKKINSLLPDLLQHHWRAQWFDVLITEIRGKPPISVLYCYVDFPERQKLAAKATVSHEEYHKLKIPLLVVTVAWIDVDGQHKKSYYCYIR